jgi:phosphatidylserine/phosphatidylglycerophosphate/cardiolipin synthase-like enzyme
MKMESSAVLGFSPQGEIEKNLVNEITAENLRLDFLAYGFNNQNIGNAVLSLLARRLPVRGVEDTSETHGAQAKLKDQLTNAGAEVLIYNPPSGIQHNKIFIFRGRRKVATGSYNFTDRAQQHNDENNIILPFEMQIQSQWGNTVEEAYSKYFDSVWANAKPEPTALRSLRRFGRDVRSRLTGPKF